jgi:polysaccharide biosynthesis protein PslH
MNVLFLTTILPSQRRMGSEVASQCFIEALRQQHQVSVVGYMRQDDPFIPAASELVVERRYIETQRAKWYPILWMLLSFWINLPYSSVKYYSKSYLRLLKTLLSQNHYDLIVIDHPQLSWLRSLIPEAQKQVMIAHNIEHEIYRQQAQSARNWLARWIYRREARLIQSLEDNLAADADQVWALTAQDAKHFANLEGVRRVLTVTLPAGMAQQTRVNWSNHVTDDLDDLVDHPSHDLIHTPTDTPQIKTHPPIKQCQKVFAIGLIGSWAWRPNEEGLRWFLATVYPLLPADLTIHIAGRGADWLINQYPNIYYRGFVVDAQVFMAQAQVVAIPTLSGSGIQIKTLEAIASGSMIVATSIAMRGIADLSTVESTVEPAADLPASSLPPTVQISDQPQQFAKALLTAIQQPQTSQAAALNWYQARRSKFLSEINQAVISL